LHQSRVVELVPKLLNPHEKEGPQLLKYVRKVATIGRPLHEEGKRPLEQLEILLASQTLVETGQKHS